MKSDRRSTSFRAAAAHVYAPLLIALFVGPVAFVGIDQAAGQSAAPTADALIGTPKVRVTSTVGVSVAVIVAGAGRAGPIAESEPQRSEAGTIDVVLRGEDGSVHPIRPGERLTVTVDGREFAGGVAPDASGRVVPSEDKVVGIVDRTGSYVARAWRPDGTPVARMFDIAEAGIFSIDMTDLVDLRPETPVELIAQGPVMAFRSRALAERVTVTLGADRLAGLAPPGATVAGTVRDGTGRSIADASGTADALGRFELALNGRDGERFRLRSGDDLLIAWLGRADPLTFVIPSLVVDVDPDRGRISGSALASWHVDVGVRSADGWESWHIPTDASGRFALSLPGGIGPGDSGYVAIDLSERARVSHPWVVPDIEVEIGGSVIAGAGIGGQRIEAELVRRGMSIGQAQSAVPPTGGFSIAGCERCDWNLELRDAFALPVPILAGDVLRVGVDSGWTEVETPLLTLDANPETDGIRGKSMPGRPLQLQLGPAEAPRAEIDLIPAEDGTYAGNFPGEDIRAGDLVGAAAKLGGMTFRAYDAAWRLTLDLSGGRLKGHARPGERIVAAIDSDDELAAFAEGAADLSGAYELVLLDRDGAPIRPRPGDRLRVESGGRELNVTIPSISIDADPVLDVVSGEAPPEGEIVVWAIDERGIGGGRVELVAERAGATGYSAALSDRFDVSGGDHVGARFSSTAGDRFELVRRLPLIAVQSGGQSVSGFTGPSANVHFAVERTGVTAASAVASSNAEGRFSHLLDDDAAFRLTKGDIISTEWSGETVGVTEMATTVLAPISTTIMAAARTVIGKTAPGVPVVVTVQEPGAERWPPVAVPAAMDGRFSIQLPGLGALPAGTIVDASADDPFGHRTWVRTTLARLEIEIANRIVRGVAAPLSAYDLLVTEAGETVAQGSARTDTFGGFEAVLSSKGPAAGVNMPGQTLSIAPDGSPDTGPDKPAIAALLIPTLSIAIDHEARLVHGVAPPHTSVTVILDPSGRPSVSIDVPVGAGGAWSVHESEFPTGVDIGALRGLIARTTTREGHFVSVSAESRTGPTATSTPATGTTPVTATTPPTTATPYPTETAATEAPIDEFSIYLPWTFQSGEE